MVKLQPSRKVCDAEISCRFPLWHGKVATWLYDWEAKLEYQFPLWHGKVATSLQAGTSRDLSMFPLWHGKVATPTEDKPHHHVLPCFRFGMVKLQLAVSIADAKA